MMCKPAGRQVLMMTGEGPGTMAVVRPLGMLWSSPCSAPRYRAPSSRVMCYATPPSRLCINVGLALATATCFGYMVLPPAGSIRRASSSVSFSTKQGGAGLGLAQVNSAGGQ